MGLKKRLIGTQIKSRGGSGEDWKCRSREERRRRKKGDEEEDGHLAIQA